MAFVVQEAAPKILSFEPIISLLIPWTIFLSLPLTGAVKRTLSIPLHFKSLPKLFSSLQTPVLSINKAFLIPCFV